MKELKNLGERLTSIVAVEYYALGLLKMLDTHTQKEVASYVGVSPAKLSPIIQLLSDMYLYKPSVIIKYVVSSSDTYHITSNMIAMDSYELLDIFRLSLDSYDTLIKDLNAKFDKETGMFSIDKLPQLTIDAIHNIEYRYKA